MSQKKETTILFLSLLVTLGLVGGGLWLFKEQIFPQNQSANNLPTTDNQSIADRISFGEKTLTPGEVTPAKKEGVQALANQNYGQAIASLEKSLKIQRNDPTALIYLNNARIASSKSYSIVASIPLGTAPNSSLEILRGIAQAQNAINTSGGIKGVPLKVGIANDDDNPEISEQIAANLVKNSDILGVVGPNASDTTLAAGTIYNTGKLVAISPTSTSVKITNFSPYVFRTVPSDFMAARSLANYMVKNLQKTQVAVFFNSQSNYSQSLKTEFVSSVAHIQQVKPEKRYFNLSGQKVAKVKTELQVDVKDIDHLGIIAGIIDEIGIVEIIDQEIGTHAQEKVSAGLVVKAMIINCMGFITAPLYLFSQFFVGKATEHLIGVGVEAEHLNDSRLGRVLDQLYEYGVSLLFLKIACVMAECFGIKISNAHIDGTSLSVHGKYLKSVEGEQSSAEDILSLEEESEPVAININHGYSRDHRPDLKQFTLSLLTTGEEGIPLFMQVGDGNELDQNAFPKMIQEFQSQWLGEQPEVYVMDAAFYTEKNLKQCSESINWISRVPLTIKVAQELTQILLPEQFIKSNLYEEHSFCAVCSEYAGIKQRWIIVESELRRDADLKKLLKRIEQSLILKIKSLKSLQNKEFACEADALIAAKDFEKTLNYHLLDELKILAKPHYQRRGKPKPGDEVSYYTYHIQANLVENKIVIKTHHNQAGRFILATNSLDEKKWTNDNDLILQEYKGQQTTERGFRFIKDPLFFASRVFLKNTKRIMALAMIMTLALMVYSLGQRQLRQSLKLTNSHIPNQKGKLTARPTLRWILQCFQSVHLVFVDGIKSSIQLTDRQNLILQFLSPSSHRYYFLS